LIYAMKTDEDTSDDKPLSISMYALCLDSAVNGQKP